SCRTSRPPISASTSAAPTSPSRTGTEKRTVPVTVGAYPGTFNPPTVAHLSIAEAARRQGALDRLDLVVSTVPLGKDPLGPPLEARVSVLEAIAATRPWLGVRVTDRQLIAEVVDGYDAVV